MTAPASQTDRIEQLVGMPKVDLHRHLEGALRLETIREVLASRGDGRPDGRSLQQRAQFHEGDPRTSDNFLAKFRYLRQIYRSRETIERVAREAVVDAAEDGIRYLELRITPTALAQAGGFQLEDVLHWVLEATREEAEKRNLGLGLIISINREEPLEFAEELARLAMNYQDRGVVGMDLAGNERAHPAGPFREIFHRAKGAGLGITIHAGEWDGPEAVRYAIEAMGADRIGHGVRVLEDRTAVHLALEHRVTFEVCLTSNLQSGVVPSFVDHPLPQMLDAGLQVTLNSDDPGVSDQRLSGEYQIAIVKLGLSVETLKGLVLTAAQASFLPTKRKRDLVSELQKDLGLGF